MKMKRLTKREDQIMEILWNSPSDMSAHDICVASDGLSIYTIQQVLQRLLSMEFIEVSGIGKNKKSITRLYRPVISQAQYISTFINKPSLFELAANLISSNEDIEVLNQLEEMIKQKQKELKDQ